MRAREMRDAGSAMSALSVKTLKSELVQLCQQGLVNEARRLGEELVRRDDRDAEAWYLLGAVFGSLGNYAEAERCCTAALALAPDNTTILLNLGIALLQQGKTSEAIAPLRRTVTGENTNPEPHIQLGNALHLTGRHDEAIVCYEAALRISPNVARVHYNLAAALFKAARHSEAAAHYDRALRLEPNLLEAWLGLADVHLETYRYDGAIRVLTAAIAQFPENFEIHYRLGCAYDWQGETAEARKQFNAALELKPADAKARASYAMTLALSGDEDAASREIDRLVLDKQEPSSVAVALGYLARRLGREKQARELIGRALVDEERNGMRSKLLFALAALEDRAGEYQSAFHHVAEANRLKGAKFNREEWRQTVADSVRIYSEDFVTRMPRSTQTSERPVFIIGMPRSGTSLVEQILASHPAVFGAGELYTLTGIAADLPRECAGARYPGTIPSLGTETLVKLHDRYLDELSRRNSTALRVTDKAPGNFLYLGLIAQMLNGARIIHCNRDPLDTCLSCFFHDFTGAHAYSYDLTDLGFYYRGYERLMGHWHAVLDLPILDIRYEDLVANPEIATRQLIEFVGLPWDERCMAPHRTRRIVSTASHDQVREPIHGRSAGRWINYDHYLDPLRAALGDGLAFLPPL
jgi:tetratricopeptide (TPR) repeat protein